jgi:hypothetical protein
MTDDAKRAIEEHREESARLRAENRQLRELLGMEVDKQPDVAVVPRQILAQGFYHDNVRVPLMGPQGIFKPRIFPVPPMSITAVPQGPYDDGFEEEGVLYYRITEDALWLTTLSEKLSPMDHWNYQEYTRDHR